MPPRIPDDKREAILADIKSGLPRNEIARKHHRSGSTVTRIAQEAGLESAFDRSETKNATEAAAADNAASRARLAARFLDEAHKALDDLHRPHNVFNFGGKDNTFNERELPEPPTGDKRNLMIIAATAVDKSMALDRHDSGAGAEQVGSLLGAMFSEMASRHGDPQAQ